MINFQTLDMFARDKIRTWPQTPPGLEHADSGGDGVWLKARPGPVLDAEGPMLKIPGAARMRTVPDGLWLWFGGTPGDMFVDLFAIEVCGNLQNLLDKRSRYTPSLHSLLVTCPANWLHHAVSEHDDTPRWQKIVQFEQEPKATVALPVRDIRVLYALKPRQFHEFAAHNIAHAHELFAPIDALVDDDGWRSPALRRFLSHAARRANIWDSGFLGSGEPADQPRRSHLPAGSFDSASSKVRPIGNHAIHTKRDHPLKRLGRIDRPGQDCEADRLRLCKLGLIDAGMERRPARSPRGSNSARQLAVELA